MTGTLTEQLLRKGESEQVAFITNVNPKERIAQVVCAMLNGKGGSVLVGVDDRGAASENLSDNDVREIQTFLRERISPQVLFTVSGDETEKGRVVCIDVPPGPDKPYVYDGGVFVRIGSKTQPADAESLRRMVGNRAAETDRWERRVASGLEVDDLDTELLYKTVRRAQTGRGYRFSNPDDRMALLGELSLMRFGRLSNAADVLFGRRVALRHPQTRMRAVQYATDKSRAFLDEQLFEGPAFRLLEDAMAFLQRHISISAEFRPGQLSRETRPEYPFDALREGLVNALVHRDYAGFSGGVSVSIYPGRIEIWNSGSLPPGLTPKRLREPTHESILVNPDISHVFYLHELMERVGRGTFKIVQDCRAMGMRTPEWKNSGTGVMLTMFAASSEPASSSELNERQLALLEALEPGDQISLRDYIDRFASGISERHGRRDLNQLRELELLQRRGAGPSTTYERSEGGV